jgi:RHS repeat-associated protein
LAGPDAQVWRFRWEHPAGTPANFYRLVEVADPLPPACGWNVQYGYDPNFPTLLTRISEPPDGQGNDQADTTLAYYTTGDSEGPVGQLKLVCDANGVHHRFFYDEYGYLARTWEGLEQAGRDAETVNCLDCVQGSWVNNPLGWPMRNGADDSSGNDPFNTVCHDSNGNVVAGTGRATCEYCVMLMWKAAGDDPGRGPRPPVRLGRVPSPQGFQVEAPSRLRYDVVGRPTIAESLTYLASDSQFQYRERTWSYDALGRPRQLLLNFRQQEYESIQWQVEREFRILQYDPDGRPLQILGPSGGQLTYTYDALGRVQSIVRTDADNTVGVMYAYDAAGRLTEILQTDGVNIRNRTVRTYDAADRLVQIDHRDAADNVLLRITYAWNPNNTVASRTETDYTVDPPTTTVVAFTYDARQRLIGETRIVQTTPPQVAYALGYTYDQLGNRRTKYDAVRDRLTEYVYDTDPNAGLAVWQDPNGTVRTRNNRLLRYYDYGPDGQGGYRLERTVWYTYYQTGDVANITLKDEPPPGVDVNDPNSPYNWYYDLAMYYTLNKQLFRALWDRWRLDPQTQGFSAYERLWRRDFQYDGPQELVQVQDYRPAGGTAWDPNALPARRTDYLAGQPVEEYVTEAWAEEGGVWRVELRPTQRYLSGLGVHAQQAVVGDPNNAGSNVPGYFGGETMHLHGDLIRSMLLRTDEGGQPVAVGGGPSAVLSYTAFGEPVWADPNGVVRVGFPPAGFGTRYQYAGGWGYETGLPTGELYNDFRFDGVASEPRTRVRGRPAAWVVGSDLRSAWWWPARGVRGRAATCVASSDRACRRVVNSGSGVEGGVHAVDADAWGRSDEFQPPDDVLGLAGVNPAVPPLRLLHVGWRWYDPALGRFVQRDPIGLTGGLNVYVYLRANPVCVVDPLGLLPGEQWVVDWLSRHPRLAEGFINITGGRSSWLDDPKKVDQAVIVAGGIGILAAGGGIVCVYMGWDCLIWGAMKAGQLINPRPIPVRPPSPPVRPPSPSWDWWDDWMNDPQFWL